ncbi:MAG: aminoglycoside phosphotransferase [Desulfuromonas sp.]|nr:MAG: aminoglycoside phosphotransferase [Desulfuromonas sp.]
MKGDPDSLMAAMLRPDFYDHPVLRVEMVETHASRVFLAGALTYKVKKPVDFGFLDFSTLRRRHHFCHEEVRLNSRFAPGLYLGVVRIGGHPGALKLGGIPAVDYAVVMKRFPHQNQCDRLLMHGRLETNRIEKFADYIANLHAAAPTIRAGQHYGTPRAVARPILENFRQIPPVVPAEIDHSQLTTLEEWSQESCASLKLTMSKRRKEGFVRECHGDLHLGNMIWHNKQPLLFDGIEFNPSLRWIDVINDIAFLVMDLDERKRQDLGWSFLNRYLLKTGDYAGLELLRFYQTYRAMVRAKVLALRLAQPGVDERERRSDLELLQAYLDLAHGYTTDNAPTLVITFGPSGSGKTSMVEKLAPLMGGIILHSDAERKRLHGLRPNDISRSHEVERIYGKKADDATYAHLLNQAERLLELGLPVFIDATYTNQTRRESVAAMAARCKLPYAIIEFTTDPNLMGQRIEQRKRDSISLSDATPEVLKHQLHSLQPLRPEERGVSVQASPEDSPQMVAARLQQVLRQAAPDIPFLAHGN